MFRKGAGPTREGCWSCQARQDGTAWAPGNGRPCVTTGARVWLLVYRHQISRRRPSLIGFIRKMPFHFFFSSGVDDAYFKFRFSLPSPDVMLICAPYWIAHLPFWGGGWVQVARVGDMVRYRLLSLLLPEQVMKVTWEE